LGHFAISADADLAIRLRRAAFNRALAGRDLGAIGSLLAPEAVLVTGTDSAVIAGRKAQVRVWQREFASAMPTTYARTPATVQVSPVEPIAFEQGHWLCVASADAIPIASGIYTAKWRRIGADWVIEAELYLTLG